MAQLLGRPQHGLLTCPGLSGTDCARTKSLRNLGDLEDRMTHPRAGYRLGARDQASAASSRKLLQHPTDTLQRTPSHMAFSIGRRLLTTTARRLEDAARSSHKENLKTETKKNPELYILGGIMFAAIVGAGAFFGRSPTKSTSETYVALPAEAMPWETETMGKYKYHPRGNTRAMPEHAPSALHTTIIPDVTVPKSAHERFQQRADDRGVI